MPDTEPTTVMIAIVICNSQSNNDCITNSSHKNTNNKKTTKDSSSNSQFGPSRLILEDWSRSGPRCLVLGGSASRVSDPTSGEGTGSVRGQERLHARCLGGRPADRAATTSTASESLGPSLLPTTTGQL